ncbi:MAG: aminodeoxychorismate lyase [Candidatus Binatia bacterium]|nr:MAG: aminodeoxychorismate lyase [Candidatus Binatia bacterium]
MGGRKVRWIGWACAVVASTAFVLRGALSAPVRLPTEGVVLRIPQGAATREVARRLVAAGIVRSEWAFRGLARWNGSDRRLRPGSYRFFGLVRPSDVLAALTAEEKAPLRTFPEGLRASEIFALLSRMGFGSVDSFESVARSPAWLRAMELPWTGVEGYLFPDTYAFPETAEQTEILSRMIDRFRERFAVLEAPRRRLGLTVHETVTLASLIEKEARIDSERPLISAVFHNRLRLGMPLQSDPTAVYERAAFSGPIRPEDLSFESPYNTYLRPGLPPGPICNPGFTSLEAAVHPASVDYLYFVARNDGSHEFSATLAEHNRAVRRRTAGRGT